MRGDEFFRMVAAQRPFSRMHPRVAGFFKEYLAHEKVVRFGGGYVLNMHFPPYPGPAFDAFARQFGALGRTGAERRLYSVTWAVTNRCGYRCWHCYNAGRSQADLPIGTMRRIAAEIRERGAVMVTLSGGEPLLRGDLEEIARVFDDRSCLLMDTTGDGLTADRAKALRDAGLFAVGVSLDSADGAEHDRLRGRPGAFETALRALQLSAAAGLYPYVVAVATRGLLERPALMALVRRAAETGAREVHLLEPSPTGRLAGRTDVLLSPAERERVLGYQREFATREEMPILSSFAYVESAQAFGCGAGLTHLYLDGSGEVCPCNLVPLSFGNAARERLDAVLGRMGRHFARPRTECVGRELAEWLPAPPETMPAPPGRSEGICARCLPRDHDVPRFFEIMDSARDEVGADELREAYDRIHGDYDAFWLAEAAAPARGLVERLGLRGDERIFEAGCGTGYATRLLAERLSRGGSICAADISEGMLGAARERLAGVRGVAFLAADALDALPRGGPFNLVFSSWVLGYIPLSPFFKAARRALAAGGRLAFLLHRDNSPRVPLEIFAELVAEDPRVLAKRVAFDFPPDSGHLRRELAAAGFVADMLEEGAITFRYPAPRDVLVHLLKSGAGTAYYDALLPERRAEMEERFVRRLEERQGGRGPYEVVHDYFSVIARQR